MIIGMQLMGNNACNYILRDYTYIKQPPNGVEMKRIDREDIEYWGSLVCVVVIAVCILHVPGATSFVCIGECAHIP